MAFRISPRPAARHANLSAPAAGRGGDAYAAAGWLAPPSANCDTTQRMYQRKVHGIGTMKMHDRPNSTARHNSPQPLAVNTNACAPPSIRRHIQRVQAVHTQAQPMMLNTETIMSRYHPSIGQ